MKKITITTETARLRLSYEPDNSEDYLIAIEAEADGFQGHADGHVAGEDWARFKTELIQLEQNRNGKAQLLSALPEEFDVSVQSTDSCGHMSISGALRYRKNEWPEQRLHFEFPFDPSQLTKVAKLISGEKG